MLPAAALALLSLALAARASAAPLVTLTVNTSAAFDVAAELVSVCLSVYAPYAPGQDPQNADWANADILTMDLADPDFRALSAALSEVGLASPVPTVLRIGGSYNDAVVYETPEEACPPGSIHGARPPTTPPPNGPVFCLTRTRWAEIVAYSQAAGLQILFGVNFYAGRNSTPGGPHSGPANLTNLGHWLAMNAGLAYPALRGIELGNELSDVPPAVYGADVVRARALLDSAYAGSPAARPLLTGPALNFWDGAYLKELFADASVVAALDVATFHHYGPKAVDIVTVADAWSPSFLVQAAEDAGGVRAETPLWTASGKPLWVSETALAWDSGRNGTSNTFSDGPWYITQLAGMAWHGVSVQARQTLRGGFYQLLSNDTGSVAPNPDWWTARLFKRAVGTRFFHTASSQPCCAPDTLFAYAACARSGGGLSVAYVNPSGAAVAVEVAGAGGAPYPMAPRAEWALQSGGPALNATRMLLNGAPLAYAGGVLTPIEPRAVTDPSAPLLIAAHSYGFFTLQGADVAAACAAAA